MYTPVEQSYVAVQDSPEFQELRKRYRGWVLPVAAASLAWYFLYVLLAAYATDFMAEPLLGNINVGLVLGLLQFASTFGVTALVYLGLSMLGGRSTERSAEAGREPETA